MSHRSPTPLRTSAVLAMAVWGFALAGPAVGAEVAEPVARQAVVAPSPAHQAGLTHGVALGGLGGMSAAGRLPAGVVSPGRDLLPMTARRQEEATEAEPEGMTNKSILLILLGLVGLFGIFAVWVISRSRSELEEPGSPEAPRTEAPKTEFPKAEVPKAETP